ncbi:hypothetical protein ACFXP3_11590 [Streptomyces sp. NPDC059096]|uniref:hypothetical protein n=1 Tax=unclassified Streptomyces TaxID=2593676 RepID=UPI0036C3B000
MAPAFRESVSRVQTGAPRETHRSAEETEDAGRKTRAGKDDEAAAKEQMGGVEVPPGFQVVRTGTVVAANRTPDRPAPGATSSP